MLLVLCSCCGILLAMKTPELGRSILLATTLISAGACASIKEPHPTIRPSHAISCPLLVEPPHAPLRFGRIESSSIYVDKPMPTTDEYNFFVSQAFVARYVLEKTFTTDQYSVMHPANSTSPTPFFFDSFPARSLQAPDNPFTLLSKYAMEARASNRGADGYAIHLNDLVVNDIVPPLPELLKSNNAKLLILTHYTDPQDRLRFCAMPNQFEVQFGAQLKRPLANGEEAEQYVRAFIRGIPTNRDEVDNGIAKHIYAQYKSPQKEIPNYISDTPFMITYAQQGKYGEEIITVSVTALGIISYSFKPR